MLDHTDFAKIENLMKENIEFRNSIEKLMKYHTYVLSSISHELRTPLTLLKSSLQLIETKHPQVKDYKYWDLIQEDIKSLNDLLIEVTTHAKFTTLDYSPVNLDLLISKLVASYQVILSKKSYSISYRCMNKNYPTVTCDSLKIRQVLISLINNAIEALDKEGKISLILSLENEYAKIEVIDNGCGIPSAYEDKIFELFVTTKKNGTGIGLSHAHKIITQHRGSITFSTRKDVGTSFTILLPINSSV